MSYKEYNFDGIVGPTHNYAGLSYGNVASLSNSGKRSRPRLAALQGLKKMWYLHDLGIPQGVFPPALRPNKKLLRNWGVKLDNSSEDDLLYVSLASSASTMWTANAATVSPSLDTKDGKLHFSPANLLSNAHRSHEWSHTYKLLQNIFSDEKYFKVHPPLEGGITFSDEGAANHTRLYSDINRSGLEIFVYGREALSSTAVTPKIYPARQTKEASKALMKRHGVEKNSLFVQQNPDVIDAGVFHNDVISVGSGPVLMFHEMAFLNSDEHLKQIREKITNYEFLMIKNDEISVNEAVKSYMFNSQLVWTEKKMHIIAPNECLEVTNVKKKFDELELAGNSLEKVHYLDVRESMQNGGGPACLRLRVLMHDSEVNAVTSRVLLNKSLYDDLVKWVGDHYRDELSPMDLLDKKLWDESEKALFELADILKLPNLYC